MNITTNSTYKMSKTNLNVEKIAREFSEYCERNKYQIKSSKDASNDLRIEISNILERTIVIIYHTGSIVMGGPKNSLKEEFTQIKRKIESNLEDYSRNEIKKTKAFKNKKHTFCLLMLGEK